MDPIHFIVLEDFSERLKKEFMTLVTKENSNPEHIVLLEFYSDIFSKMITQGIQIAVNEIFEGLNIIVKLELEQDQEQEQEQK